jgi:hypothetical protein
VEYNWVRREHEGGAVMGEVPNGQAVQRALNERLRALDPSIRAWARQCCLDHADRGSAHVDDVANVMRWECARVIRRALEAADAAAPDPSAAYLRRVAARSGDRYFHSSARTGLTGATGAARRASRARMTAGALTVALGREPTTAEVIAAMNEQASATRADPVKQGALVRAAADLLDQPVLLDEHVPAEGRLEDEVFGRISAELAVRRTIELCRAMNPELGEVADAWLGGSLAEPPVIPTVAELAELASRRPDEIRAMLDECRIVAELVCLELGLGPS